MCSSDLELRDGELVLYRGDYAYYQEKKREEELEASAREQERQRLARREANRAKQQRRDKRAKAGDAPEPRDHAA